MTTSKAVSTATVTRPKCNDENDTSSQFNTFDESKKHDGGYIATFRNLRTYGLLVGSLVGFITGCVIELCIGITYEVTYEEFDLVFCVTSTIAASAMIGIQRFILPEYIETHVLVVVNKASDSNAETHEDRELMLQLIRSTQKYEYSGYFVGICIGSTLVDVLVGMNMPILPLIVGGILMWTNVRTWLRTRNEGRFINQKEPSVMSQSNVPLLSDQTIPVTLV